MHVYKADACPTCGGPGSYLGQLGNLHHFTCRNCGIGFNVKAEPVEAEETELDDNACSYCGGNCANEPDDSPNLCDGFAGDIDNLYEDAE